MAAVRNVFSMNEEELNNILELDPKTRKLIKRIGVCLILNSLNNLNDNDMITLNNLLISIKETFTTGKVNNGVNLSKNIPKILNHTHSQEYNSNEDLFNSFIEL